MEGILMVGFLLLLGGGCWFLFGDSPSTPSSGAMDLPHQLIHRWMQHRKKKASLVLISLTRLRRYLHEEALLFSPHSRDESLQTVRSTLYRLHQDIALHVMDDALRTFEGYPDGLDFTQDPGPAPLEVHITWLALHYYQRLMRQEHRTLSRKESYYLLLLRCYGAITRQAVLPPISVEAEDQNESVSEEEQQNEEEPITTVIQQEEEGHEHKPAEEEITGLDMSDLSEPLEFYRAYTEVLQPLIPSEGQEVLQPQEPRDAREVLDLVLARYEQEGHITQAKFVGTEWLTRREWDLYLPREKGLFYQAGIVTIAQNGDVVLTYPTREESQQALIDYQIARVERKHYA